MARSTNQMKAGFLAALLVSNSFTPLFSQSAVAADSTVGSNAMSVAELTTIHASTFTALFNAEWDPEQWTYALDGPIDGVGTYTGANQLGDVFVANILHWIPLAPRAEIGNDGGAGNVDFGFAAVVAVIETDFASVAFLGTVAWKPQGVDGVAWAFMPTIPIDADSALLESHHIDLHAGTVDLDDGLDGAERDGGDAKPVIIGEKTIDACIDAAIAAYDLMVANCDAAHRTSVRACNRAYNATMVMCNTSFNLAIDEADQAFRSCMLGAFATFVFCQMICLVGTGGWGFFFCTAPCLLIASAKKVECAVDFNGAIAAARVTHQTCTGTALAARNACRVTADAVRDACVGNAGIWAAAQIVACTSNP